MVRVEPNGSTFLLIKKKVPKRACKVSATASFGDPDGF